MSRNIHLPARIFDHKLSEEELKEKFPDGYKELPEEVYKRLFIIPETFIVDEHHVHVYASKKNDGTGSHPDVLITQGISLNTSKALSLQTVIRSIIRSAINAKISRSQAAGYISEDLSRNSSNLSVKPPQRAPLPQKLMP